jgi:circadian clock protein KaiB
MVTEYVLRLYVAGKTANSKKAMDALQRLCDQLHEESGYVCTFEVVDILEYPDLAISQSIIATPTLLRLAPHPPSRVVGDLSDPSKVLLGLGGGISP